MKFEESVVYFAGVGPGDPELITIKSLQLIQSADLILYAGSLINPEILKNAKKGSLCLNTVRMHLDQQIEQIQKASEEKKIIARLHTGDPSIYGALSEQIRELNLRNIPWQIIPGVSSVFAAAAALGIEYTLPERCQSLILTRLSGKTELPPQESLRSFAGHKCSICIFLSTSMIGQVTFDLIDAGYPEDTDIAVVYRASWPDQKIIRRKLNTIENLLTSEEITHQALIIVSPSLENSDIADSHLYGNYQNKPEGKKGSAVITLSLDSVSLGQKIAGEIPEAELFVPKKFRDQVSDDFEKVHFYREGIRFVLQDAFQRFDSLICILASGIVMRELAPCLTNKHTDPAVLVLDNRGSYVISLLSGHIGGANKLAERVAQITGGTAVITTASDTQSIYPLDVLAAERNWEITPKNRLTTIISAFVNHEPVFCVTHFEVADDSPLKQLPWQMVTTYSELPKICKNLVIISDETIPEEVLDCYNPLVLCPKTLVLGIGCNKNTPAEEIESCFRQTLEQHNISLAAIKIIATISEKSEEPGICDLVFQHGWELQIVSHEKINKLTNLPNPSPYSQKLFGISGVAEPCALIASGQDVLLVAKEKYPDVTVAVARMRYVL
ncbi:MAG: precorrin-4 C(11)-methyltransferase [Flexilinea sp.]